MLPSSNRLPKEEIPGLMRHGLVIRSKELILKYKETTGAPRFTFIVSTKIDKRATKRNKIRRILSEAVRHLLPGIRSLDGVIIATSAITEAERPLSELFSKLS